MEKEKSKKQTFMGGVFTIMVAQVFIKLLGFIYRHVLILIPEFGDEGSGLYGIGFNIYMLVLTIATVGVPGAISKLVSNRVARGKADEAKYIFKVALGLFSFIGLIGTLIMLFSAKSLANLAGNEAASGVLIALAPSVFFVSIASVIRGYFNGMYNMKPASFNQTLEQIFKAGLTIAFVYSIYYIYSKVPDLATKYDINKNNVTGIMAAWANVASTCSTAIGLTYLIVYYRFHRKDIDVISANEKVKDDVDIKVEEFVPPVKFLNVLEAGIGIFTLYLLLDSSFAGKDNIMTNLKAFICSGILFLICLLFSKFHRKDIDVISANEVVNDGVDNKDKELSSLKKTIKMILALSIPMSLASVVSAINRNIDSFTVNNILQQVIPIFNPEIAISTEAIVKEATRLYGILSGKVDMLIGLPLSINIAFATALVPAITECFAKGDIKTASKRITYSLKFSMLIALPCSIGLCVMAGPILELLFRGQLQTSPEAELLLQISAFTVLFTVMNQTINASLQGIGKIFIPAIALLCGVFVKVILNLVLIHIPQINVNGAAIGSVCCHLIATIIVSRVLAKSIKLDLSKKDVILKPIISACVMAICTFLTYKLLIIKFGEYSRIATLISLGVAVLSYFICVVKINVLSKEDFELLPGGTKIYKILQKVKLVKT